VGSDRVKRQAKPLRHGENEHRQSHAGAVLEVENGREEKVFGFVGGEKRVVGFLPCGPGKVVVKPFALVDGGM
jgi:hypothetical protein